MMKCELCGHEFDTYQKNAYYENNIKIAESMCCHRCMLAKYVSLYMRALKEEPEEAAIVKEMAKLYLAAKNQQMRV